MTDDVYFVLVQFVAGYFACVRHLADYCAPDHNYKNVVDHSASVDSDVDHNNNTEV